MSQLLDSPSSTVTLPKPDATPVPVPRRALRHRPPQPPRRGHEPGVEVEIGDGGRSDSTDAHDSGGPDRAAQSSPSDRPPRHSLRLAHEPGLSSQERRQRLESLVFELADTPEFTSRLAIYKRHTMREISAAAGLRPDLMPTLNDEFEHLVLFAP